MEERRIKTTLTVEESDRLIDLGVDPKLASEIEYRPKKSGYGRLKYRVYSLADILSILPKEIGHMRILTINSTNTLYFAFYAHWEKEYLSSYEEKVTHGINDKAFSAPELIDALYQLLIWAIEQKYVKTNKDN